MYVYYKKALSLHGTVTVSLRGGLVGSLALEQIETILVCLQLGDGNLAGINTNWNGLTYDKWK